MTKHKFSAKSLVGLVFVLISTFFLAFVAGSLFFSVGDSSAESQEVDITVKVNSVLAITTNAVNNELLLDIMPTPTGTLAKNDLTVRVSTNNSTGYTLSMNSATTNTAMVHESATGSPLAPNIPSTAHSYIAPAALALDTWGWNLGDASSTTTFSMIPPSTAPYIIRTTDAPSNTPSVDSDTLVTFGANVTTDTVSGAYINTMVFTATTNYVPPFGPCGTGDYECIIFTINTTDGTYYIPTSGRVADMNHTYDWDVYVDDVLTTVCTSGNCTGTSDNANAPGVDGIALTGLSSGEHQIKIVPHNGPAPGWGNAFGHASWSSDGASAQTNKEKIISIDAPLTTMAFVPKISESTTSAKWMLAYIFYGCTNLTTPATIINTYKLPNTITDLSNFMYSVHEGNSKLAAPANLALLSGWLKTNNSITTLDEFLNYVHSDNDDLATPIDLTPLTNWFHANNSIVSMKYFLEGVHSRFGMSGKSSLATPIDLTPLAGWFDSNTSIIYLGDFLYFLHYGNSQLLTPIDLTPLAGWFVNNTSITDLSVFLADIHYGNSQLLTPIDLTPISGWFNNNNSINGLNGLLAGMHYGNNQLVTPINLAPLAGWLNNNTSVIYLENFFNMTHTNNANLTTPIDLTPLSGWFSDNHSFTSWYNFLGNIHENNPNLTLSGQTIFPNWMKTVARGTTPIWNDPNNFRRMFGMSSTKTGDTGEPKFQDGTVLSSLGAPDTNNQTYDNRSGITPVNTNWK